MRSCKLTRTFQTVCNQVSEILTTTIFDWLKRKPCAPFSTKQKRDHNPFISSLCEFSHAPQPLQASLKHFLALVISFLDCDWLAYVAADLITGPHEGNTQSWVEVPAAKALVFRFLRSLTLRRMPLTKNASWEWVCHLNALFVSQWRVLEISSFTLKNWRLLCRLVIG